MRKPRATLSLPDALANLTHRLIETLDAHERAVEALEALESIARQRPAPTDSQSPW